MKCNMQIMQNIDDLFKKFGGMQPFALACDIKYSTAAGFKYRGLVPMEYWKTIEAAAAEQGIEGVTCRTISDMLLLRYPDIEPKKKPAKRRSAKAAD